jgi:hypothetical protein
MRSEATGRSLAATTATAILGGLIGGLLVAGWQSVTRPESDATQTVPTVDAVRRQDLAAFERDIAALREALDRTARVQVAGEMPATEPAPLAPAADYGPILARLAEQIDRIAAATHAVPWPEGSLSFDPAKRDRLLPLLDGAAVPVDKWRFWTPAQLIDAYGPPSLVTPANGGIRWSYRWDDGTMVTFVIADGLALEQEWLRPEKR